MFRRRRRAFGLGALAVVLVLLSSLSWSQGVFSGPSIEQSSSATGGNNSGEFHQIKGPEGAGGSGVPEAEGLEESYSSPARAAYREAAPGLPGLEPGDVGEVYQSVLNPSWASVLVVAPNREDEHYFVFLKRTQKGWEPQKSVLANRPDYPKNVESVLGGVPRDLVKHVYSPPQNPAPDPVASAAAFVERNEALQKDDWETGEVKTEGDYASIELKKRGGSEGPTHLYLRREEGEGWYVISIGEKLSTTDVPEMPAELLNSGEPLEKVSVSISAPDPVLNGVPEEEREKVKEGTQQIKKAVAGYREAHGGVAGVYAIDLKGGWGYGARSEETFYSASVIKIPVMVAVYRRVEQGKLSLSERFPIKEEDWAAGAGGLRWQEPGTKQTVGDYLWLMMVKSDNVATNALIRKVGGRDYVNEVAASMGAEDTVLRQKVTDQRAAAPSLDNRTTPRDMAAMLQSIYENEAASPENCRNMMELMQENDVVNWAESGLPSDVSMANKSGWIDGVFNDVGIVGYKDRPYAIAILSKYGPDQPSNAKPMLKDTSKAVFETQKAVAGNGRKEEKEE